MISFQLFPVVNRVTKLSWPKNRKSSRLYLRNLENLICIPCTCYYLLYLQEEKTSDWEMSCIVTQRVSADIHMIFVELKCETRLNCLYCDLESLDLSIITNCWHVSVMKEDINGNMLQWVWKDNKWWVSNFYTYLTD